MRLQFSNQSGDDRAVAQDFPQNADASLLIDIDVVLRRRRGVPLHGCFERAGAPWTNITTKRWVPTTIVPIYISVACRRISTFSCVSEQLSPDRRLELPVRRGAERRKISAR